MSKELTELMSKELATTNVRQTAQELKQRFLQAAAPLVDEYIAAALGIADFSSVNSGAREEVWDVLKKLMLQSSDKLEIDIQSAEDVLTAVSSGKCTFEEGEKLLALFKKVKDIEVAGLLPNKASAGITINILTRSEETKVVHEVREVIGHGSQKPEE